MKVVPRAGVVALRALACIVAMLPAFAGAQVPAESGAAIADGGQVTGRVVDGASGAPVAGATVQIVGRKAVVQTGADGRFTVVAPAGTHQVRVSAPSYEAITVPNVTVKAGATVTADARLAPMARVSGGIIVNVIGRIRRAVESVQLARRKAASAVTETISAETMKKSAGSDATAAVQQAPAVTVRESGGSKSVFVRGLGDRYTTALLNGSRLPSPDAFKRAVPLDLFPTDFLEGIDVVKGYTPDLPGDFSGGLIDMRLRDYPDKLTYSLGISGGANTQTTGQDFLTYQGGGTADYFGFGEKFRNWPQSMPGFPLDELPQKRVFEIGRQFKDIWQIDTKTAPLDWGANMSIGAREGPVGFQLGGLYSVKFRSIPNYEQRQFVGTGGSEANPEVTAVDDFRGSRSDMRTRLGAVLTGAWQPAQKHTLSVRSFVNRSSTDDARIEQGIDAQQNELRQSRLRYVEDELAFVQLAGEHASFDWLKIDWRTVLTRTTRDEPDTRFTTYQRPTNDPNAAFQWSPESLGGLRLSNETLEKASDTGVDFTVPFATGLPMTDFWSGMTGKLKFGSAYTLRRRNFRQRRVEFDAATGGAINLTQPPNDVLSPENIGPGGVSVTEQTTCGSDLNCDAFKGSEEIMASYGMMELPLVKDTLRVVGGARVEYSLIELSGGINNQLYCRPDADGARPPNCFRTFRKENFDPLPSASLIYNPLKTMNIRLSWSETVSRPEFRELAPVVFPAQKGDLAVFGNPVLEQFGITNWDARWEWFFSPLELVSLGFFYKEIDRPIEPLTLQVSTQLQKTWANVESSTLYGIEAEVRKNLGFLSSLSPFLRDLTFTINGTWLDSETVVGESVEVFVPDLVAFPTTPVREAVGAPPFTVGASVEYSNPDWFTARLSYATAGDTLDLPGFTGVPNIFEVQRNRLDFVLLLPLKRLLGGTPITAKLSVENMLNDDVTFVRDDFPPGVEPQPGQPPVPRIQRRWFEGVSFSFGISYTY